MRSMPEGRERGRTTTAVVCLFAVLAMLATAWAQEAPAGRENNVPAQEGKITLDVKDRPLKDVVDYIRDKTDVNIIVAPEAEKQKVSISVKNLAWETALELVAEKADCVLTKESPNLIKIEKPPQVTFDFQDADIRKVISVIAAYSGANIVVGQEVQGTVTVRLNHVPWRAALDTVVKTLGFVVVEDERGILRVTDPAKLQQQLETRVYTFKYVRPPAPYEAYIKTDVQVDNVKQAFQKSGKNPEESFSLLKAFRAAVAPEGTLEYVPSTNSIVVTGTAPKLDQLQTLIDQVDVEPAMVGVDVQFVTTKNTDFLNVGIDPGDQGLTASISGSSGPTRLPFNLGKGGWFAPISAASAATSSGDVVGTGPTGVSPDSSFTFGTLDFTKAQFTLHLLKQDISTRIVQAPRILTLDNQAATIFVGETIRYAQTQASSNQQGGLQYSISEAANSPVQTGFQLLVLPHVIPGQQKVMMTVIPQQQSLTGTSTEQPGFNVFKGGSGANEVQIALPQTASSTVVTHMMLDSGETAVIGGLLTDTESKNTNALPLLGQLPVIGYLFRNDQNTKTKNNLIILITPHILKSAKARRAALTEELRKQSERIRQEYQAIEGKELQKVQAPSTNHSGD